MTFCAVFFKDKLQKILIVCRKKLIDYLGTFYETATY